MLLHWFLICLITNIIDGSSTPFLILNGTSYSTSNTCPLGQLSDFTYNLSNQMVSEMQIAINTLEGFGNQSLNCSAYLNETSIRLINSVSNELSLLANVYSLSHFTKKNLFQEEGEDEDGEDEEPSFRTGEEEGDDESPGNGEPGFENENGEDVYVSSSGVPISSTAYYGCSWSSCYVSYIVVYDNQGSGKQIPVTDSCLLTNATQTLTYVSQTLKGRLSGELVKLNVFDTNNSVSCTNLQSFLSTTINDLREIQTNISLLPSIFGLANGATYPLPRNILFLFVLCMNWLLYYSVF